VIGRRIAYVALVATLISAGAYVFIYLDRWEWNRAMVAGILFVGAEIALVGALLLERLRTLSDKVDKLDQKPRHVDPQVLGHIRDSAPEPSKPFAWLDPRDQRMGVFVPVLMGAGLVMSGLAWLVERLARRTAGPALEGGLAGQLSALSLPDRLVSDDDRLALLRRPAIG
jgi:hypothetical protein